MVENRSLSWMLALVVDIGLAGPLIGVVGLWQWMFCFGDSRSDSPYFVQQPWNKVVVIAMAGSPPSFVVVFVTVGSNFLKSSSFRA